MIVQNLGLEVFDYYRPQATGSLNCGILACNQIENVIRQHTPARGVYFEMSDSNYRSMMILWFIDPLYFEIPLYILLQIGLCGVCE